VTEEVADADLGTRLMGHEGAVEGREGEAHEMIGRVARRVEAEDDLRNCFQQVAHLSQAFTLKRSDVIASGTPAGIGAVRQPFPEGLLKVGDVVRVEIDGIGVLENTVIDEPEGFVVPESDEVPAWAA
jgi:Fumarylacetoacetate (FAA) hydrolase family